MIVTATATATPQPQVNLLVDAMPAGTAYVTIYRSFAGERGVVRDANRAATGGALSRPYADYDVPFGVPVTYSAYAFSTAGAQLALASSGVVQVNVSVPWISDPLAPGRAIPVVLINESLQEITHDTPGDIGSVLESELQVAIMGTTQQASSVPLRFLIPTELHRIQVTTVLRSANPFLLRVPPDFYSTLPALAFIAHTSLSVTKISRSQPEHDHIALAGVAVQPPSAPVVLSKRTYADVKGEASAYGDLPVIFADYLGLLRGERAD